MTRREIWAVRLVLWVIDFLLPEGKHRDELRKIRENFTLYAREEG